MNFDFNSPVDVYFWNRIRRSNVDYWGISCGFLFLVCERTYTFRRDILQGPLLDRHRQILIHREHPVDVACGIHGCLLVIILGFPNTSKTNKSHIFKRYGEFCYSIYQSPPSTKHAIFFFYKRFSGVPGIGYQIF